MAPSEDSRASANEVEAALRPVPLAADVSTPPPLAPDMDREILSEFVIEGKEQLAHADLRLLELEQNPNNEEAINAVFRSFHTIKGLAGFLNLEDLQAAAHAAEDLLDHARSKKLLLRGRAIDLVFQTTETLRQLIFQIGDCLNAESWPPRGLDTVPALVEAIRALLGVPDDAAASAAPPMATRLEAGGSTPDPPPSTGGSDKSIRVDSQRLDQLVDLVGELVITESMVHRAAGESDNGRRDLRRHMIRLGKITRELQELAGSLRMVAVQGLFRKMARLARDTAKKCGKEVIFEAIGEETELDRTLVERMADPLVHLMRNAIDHGLESDPLERVRRGKPSAGRVCLRASHRSGNIYIEVEDDGRGLNRAAIIEKAVQRGLLRSDETPDDRELFALICLPGFSTVSQVTAMSGRGVGMDVVKRNISAMGGSLEIRSESGQGTCFAMKLPLTLAVIDGMLVRAGGERFVIPTLSVLRLVAPRPADISTVVEAHELLEVQGEHLPLFRLSTLFDLAPSSTACRIAVVAESEGQRLAILVDELLGQQQAVIKSIGHGIGETPGVSGCAILSDGRVGLVLDIAGLLRLAKSGQNTGESGAAPSPRQKRSGGARPS